MNEILRRAVLGAGLDEVDVAARLEVDPKTVRRWLEGRVPYSRHRWALADLLKIDETVLWPELRASQPRPGELIAVYPHRSSISPETWGSFFASAKHEIGILASSGLFLAQDADVLAIFADKARLGLWVRIALADPDDSYLTSRSVQEFGRVATVARTRKALTLYQPLLSLGRVEIRLHQTLPYTPIYLADNELLVGQHVYGIPTSDAPVLHLRRRIDGDMFSIYHNTFHHIWGRARSIV